MKYLLVFLLFAHLAIVLLGCNASSPAVTPRPATPDLPEGDRDKLERTPEPTKPLVTQPVVTPTVLSVYPLSVGATWRYSTTLDYAEGKDVRHWAGTITETITGFGWQDQGRVFQVEVQGHPRRTQPGDRVMYYVALNNRLYRSPGSHQDIADLIANDGQGYKWNQVVTWPLEIGQRWGEPDMLARNDGRYVWLVEAQENVDTPAGVFTGCYRLILRTSPDHTLIWFCPGVGIARWEYHHHGSVYDEVWVLEAFHAPAGPTVAPAPSLAPSRAVEAPSGIRGQVFIGPACPGPVRIDTPCPDEPYQATIVVLNQKGIEVARLGTNAEGRFRVKLLPDTYTLVPQSPGRLPIAAEQVVTVTSGYFTPVTITYDSGMR